MWKRIRSNRNPGDTVYSEIRKEFSPYFEKANNNVSHLINKFPKGAFSLMVILMVVSLILTFTLFRHPETKSTTNIKTDIHPMSDGFDQILKAGAQLKETIRLKKLVDSITEKKQLNANDSLRLVRALDSLQHIHPSLK